MSGPTRWQGWVERLRWIARAWRPHRVWLPVLVAMTLVSTAVTLAYPLVFGHVLERVRELTVIEVVAADLDAEVRTLIAILLAIGAARLVAGFYPAFRALVNFRIELHTREAYFAGVLRKGHRFFTWFRTGDVVNRLIDDISGYPKVAWFCCSGIFRALDSSSRVVCCLGVMVWLDPPLALYTLLPVPLMVGIFVVLNRSLAAAARAQRQAASRTSEFLEASFSGVSVLQAHNAESRLGDALGRQLGERAGAEVRLAKLWVLFSIFFQALNVVGQMVVIGVGGLRVLEGSLALGDFFAFYLFLGLILAPMMDLPNLLVTGRQAFVCMDRLDELLAYDRAGEGGVCQGELRLERFEELRVEGLDYAYPRGRDDEDADAPPPPPALERVAVVLRQGERVAVVGEVGAGKTTLLRLLAGFFAPDAGEVLFNGRPLAEYAGPDLRRAVGYVPQDPVLFAASVRENVLLGRPEDPERLARALELAGLSEELAALPGGLDYSVGLRGRGLSGGQRQRLTVARALYGEPQLLLLDDITAALDAENEERFWQRILAEWPELGVLVVTHRAATARRMQRVVALEDGRRVEAEGVRE